MWQRSVKLAVLISFVSGQVWANPFGPGLPPVTPLPLPTVPSTGSSPGTNQPGLPTDPLNPGGSIGRGGNPTWPIQPSPTPNPSGPSIPIPVPNPSWTPVPTPNNPGPNPFPVPPFNPFPNNGGGSYGGGGTITLNYTCPLVDQETNGDLLAALDMLERAIQITPECRDDASLTNLQKMQEQMRTSAIELRRIWNDPDRLNENLPSFETQLQVMMLGINQLTETLNNNSLINSNCGREMMTTGKALLAVSDLVTGIAPYTLFAASAASSLSAAVPYVLGVVGVAGVIKMIGQLSANKMLDMNRYEHRQTVLKATCEYNRVATKVRYLKLAQSGQIDMLTREINQISQSMFYDQQSLGGSLDEILKGRQEFYRNIDEIRSQMVSDFRDLKELKKYLAKVNDDAMVCSLGMEIVENHKKGKFPTTVDGNFKKLLEIGIPHNELSLKATSRQYGVAIAELESNVSYVSGYRMGYCGQSTSRFINTVERILQTTEEELVVQENLFERKLSENPVYKNWYARTSTLEKDRETLKRVVKTMTKASQDSTVMSKTELHQRMESLRNALFGTSGAWTLTKSPIETWLKHTHNMHARAISAFNKSISTLMNEVATMRIKQRKKMSYIDETVSILPETFVRELLLIDVKEENFNFINVRRFPVGSSQQEVMCQRLEESWLNWAAALDHLMAMKHFCSNITSFIDSKTGSGVVEACGRRKIDGKEDNQALIATTERDLVKRGYQNLAVRVSKKLSELNCVGR